MKLNKNSFTIRLYKYFYSTEQLPTNLCPLFWKLVVMWVFIIPFTIFTIPALFMKDIKGVGQKFVASLILYVILIALILMLSPLGLFFISYNNELFMPFWINGLIIDSILILIGIYFAIKYLVDKNKYERMENPKSNSIVTEFVKAKYNKYCPKIDWE